MGLTNADYCDIVLLEFGNFVRVTTGANNAG